jgi:hypothetical protein
MDFSCQGKMEAEASWFGAALQTAADAHSFFAKRIDGFLSMFAR